MNNEFTGQPHPAPKITMERAQEIVQGHFGDHGPRAVLRRSSWGVILTDGCRIEPARLDSEDALRAQCRGWRR